MDRVVKLTANKTLSYEIWEFGCIEPLSWGWAYIQPNEDIDELKPCGEYQPIQKDWGKNIVNGYRYVNDLGDEVSFIAKEMNKIKFKRHLSLKDMLVSKEI